MASHADGLGFSCAQTYNTGGARRIEFAIADSGRGMLKNVQRISPDINSDSEAISWCLQRGNTTARRVKTGDWAQRLPDDAVVSPYPSTVPIQRNEDHHVGEGLWKLAELTRNLDGKLWVASGKGQVLIESGKEVASDSRINWLGVAIELEIVVSADYQPTPEQQAGIERLARRIGFES